MKTDKGDGNYRYTNNSCVLPKWLRNDKLLSGILENSTSLKYSPLLKKAYHFQNKLTSIFNQPQHKNKLNVK